MLSVICPIYNEEKYIAGCIDSIIAQDYPKDDIEVIFADGMSSDQTRKIVAQYAERYNWIRLVDNPRKIVPPALNAAVKASRGDVIIRIDAHASYPSNYFSALASALKHYDADNVGAVCRTDVLVKTPKSLAIKEVLAHPLGVGILPSAPGLTVRERWIPCLSVVGNATFLKNTDISMKGLSAIRISSSTSG